MELKEILKEQGLTEEQVTSVLSAMKDNEIYTTSLENADERYTKLKGQKESLEQEVSTANTTIADLKKSNKDNEELQNAIKEHEDTISTLKKQYEDTTKSYALKSELIKQGVLDADYIIFKQGGLDNFEFDKEGNPIHVDDIVKKFKEDKAMTHIFQATQQQTYSPAGGNGGTVTNPFAKDTFNLTEQGRLFKEDPVRARELASAAGIQI